ncbi:MAG TPA: polysaccharide biosynthesis/export family protein [Longimicrobium sp.]|jgi:polysaccharide export outer membrane protein|nr:polysaccharide biosynthesis/export family protein [Longimicrobium sp.]
MKRLLLLLAVASVLPAPLRAQAADDLVIQPGDAVQITVWRKPEFSGEFSVAASGAVDHPLYQDVVLAGVPMSVVRQRLRDFLSTWESDPRFVVKPLFRVAVGGEVTKPDLYALAPETTIVQAVARAGGVTARGRLNRVRVLRAGGDFTVDLTRSDSPLARTTVRSGDQIVVEQRGSETFRQYIAPAGTFAMAAVSLLSLLFR